ncbi:MAG: hypothetical protein ACK4TC_02195 [Sphingomonas pseudosanguinis]|uniref:hypothetical protein n=1 Tax=Sphingomonas pseudosanguinis TaxID=413712 RepID=UPI0039194290
MSDSLRKYANLVNMLLVKTKAEKISWDYDNSRSTISVWNGDVLLSIKVSTDENFEDIYSLSLINRSGVYLESFSDTDLNGIETGDDYANYFVKMRDLFNLAKRQATGADKALDDFMRALERDDLDGVPF